MDTKARWASRKADEARAAALAVRSERGGDWRDRANRDRAARFYDREAARFDALASRYLTRQAS